MLRPVVVLLVLSLTGCVTSTFSNERYQLVKDKKGIEHALPERINYSTSRTSGYAAWHVRSNESLIIAGTFSYSDISMRGTNTTFLFVSGRETFRFLPVGPDMNGFQGEDNVRAHAEIGPINTSAGPGQFRPRESRVVERHAIYTEAFSTGQEGWIVAIWSDDPSGVALQISLPAQADVSPVVEGEAVCYRIDDFTGGATVATPLAGAHRTSSLVLPPRAFAEVRTLGMTGERGTLTVRLANETHVISLEPATTSTQVYQRHIAWLQSDSTTLELDEAGQQTEHDLYVLVAQLPPISPDGDFFLSG